MALPNHPEFCRCEACIDYRTKHEKRIEKVRQQLEAEEAAEREAGVPLDARRRAAAESRAALATIEAENLDRVRQQLQAGIRFATQRAERVAVMYRGRRNLKKEDATEFFGATQRAAELFERDRRIAKMQKRAEKRAEKARVVTERDPYAKGSPHSWVADVLAAHADTGDGSDSGLATPIRSDGGHAERLQRHGALVIRAIDRRSKYGRWIIEQHTAQYRQADVNLNRKTVEKAEKDLRSLMGREFRALSTGGGATASASGGGAAAFVAPAILMNAWAQYRSPYRAFADQCDNSVPLPAFGLQAYVPTFTTGTTVATDTEGSSTPENDPVTNFVSGAIVQKAGQIQVSQAVLDRVGPGIAGDVILYQQLKNQLGAQVDPYAITQVTANAATVTNSGTFAVATASGVGGFVGDLKHAKSKLTDTAGIRLRATHAFAQDDLVDYVCSWADASGRPIVTPAFDDSRLPVRSQGDQLAQGYSGYVLGGLALFGDSNIPTTTNFCQIVVCRPDTILLLEGPPVTYVRPQFQAGNLEPVVGVYEYTTAIAKFPQGVAVISGAAYTASTFA